MNKMLRTTAVALASSAFILGAGANAAELRVGSAFSPKPLGYPWTDTSHSAGFIYSSTYDLLTYPNIEGPQPGLAVSWKNTSPTTWEVKLRPGVKFHNGDPLNADHLVNQINWLVSDEGAAKAASTVRDLRSFAGAKKIDDMTFEISTKKPDVLTMSTIAKAKILNWRHFQDVDVDGYGRDPIGTGPFAATTWTNDRIEVEPFADGWRKGQVDKIRFVILPENASRVQAFASDQIDVALGMNADARTQIEAADGFMFTAQAPQVLLLMAFQNKASPVADQRVRQALNYAVDKKGYIDGIMGGLTVPASQPASSTVFGYQPDIKPYPHDPQKARSLLAEAGFGNGLSLRAEVVVNVAELGDVYQQVSLDLKKVGVDLELNIITLPDLIARVRDTSKFGDTTLFSFNMGSEPMIDMMRSINALHSCNAFPKWICFPDIEPAIAAANQEFDSEKRSKLLREIALYYHDNPPGIFLHEEVQVDAVKNHVKGYTVNNRIIPWHEVTLDAM